MLDFHDKFKMLTYKLPVNQNIRVLIAIALSIFEILIPLRSSLMIPRMFILAPNPSCNSPQVTAASKLWKKKKCKSRNNPVPRVALASAGFAKGERKRARTNSTPD